MNYKMNKIQPNEKDIYNLCFHDLINSKYHGYGSKRISIKIPGTISCTIPCSGFGFKDENNVLHLGVRLYLDQGDFVKFKVYDKGYSMFEHFSELILKFDKEYSNFK